MHGEVDLVVMEVVGVTEWDHQDMVVVMGKLNDIQ
jgi:hypothetical protein